MAASAFRRTRLYCRAVRGGELKLPPRTAPATEPLPTVHKFKRNKVSARPCHYPLRKPDNYICLKRFNAIRDAATKKSATAAINTSGAYG